MVFTCLKSISRFLILPAVVALSVLPPVSRFHLIKAEIKAELVQTDQSPSSIHLPSIISPMVLCLSSLLA